MSDFTECNYCTLQWMKRQAAARGVEIILERNKGWTTARYSDEEEVSASFLKLTDHCVC